MSMVFRKPPVSSSLFIFITFSYVQQMMYMRKNALFNYASKRGEDHRRAWWPLLGRQLGARRAAAGKETVAVRCLRKTIDYCLRWFKREKTIWRQWKWTLLLVKTSVPNDQRLCALWGVIKGKRGTTDAQLLMMMVVVVVKVYVVLLTLPNRLTNAHFY